jgi:hypothetical protein
VHGRIFLIGMAAIPFDPDDILASISTAQAPFFLE